MPLTPIQAEVLRIIVAHRSPGSHVAGGIALNSAPDSARFSKDIDIFHDGIDPLAAASEADTHALADAGFAVHRRLWQVGFRRALITRGADEVMIEWAYIDAWRFFPVEPDAILGWRLHAFDAITNKAMALAGRSETRDLIDLVSHAEEYPIERVVWASCAKDVGWNPHSLLARMRRNAVVRPDQLDLLGAHFTPITLKERWLEISDAAELRIDEATRAGADPGLVYVTPEGRVSWFDDAAAAPLAPKMGSVLPRIVG
ncbi:MAG: nucleotidyl transferase AbiEii/AbiGii toxin family protein [Chthoniobacteraceae bacterium]